VVALWNDELNVMVRRFLIVPLKVRTSIRLEHAARVSALPSIASAHLRAVMQFRCCTRSRWLTIVGARPFLAAAESGAISVVVFTSSNTCRHLQIVEMDKRCAGTSDSARID
jgi:hypothetical protein